MHLRLIHRILAGIMCIIELIGGDQGCPSFDIRSTSVTGNREDNMNATVEFTVHKSCNNKTEYIKSVKVFREKTLDQFGPSTCYITFKTKKCSFQAGCSCDNQSRVFYITRPVADLDGTTLHFFGEMIDSVKFNKTVTISLKVGPGLQSTSAYAETVSLSEAFDATTIQLTVSPQTDGRLNAQTDEWTSSVPAVETKRTSESHIGFIILGGVVGFVLLAVIVLSVCMGVLFWKKGRSRRLPPPPAPHNVIRTARDGAVVFHAAHGDRASVLSIMGHDYAEIPDETDPSQANSSLESVYSHPVSDMSDCLHHIACPSSDSSLPEDYLNPVASSWEAVAIATIKEERCISSSSSEAVMYAEERITFKKKPKKKVNLAQSETT